MMWAGQEVQVQVLYLFRVLFRERGILLFFHVGKMTTYRAKILRFRCGYFRL